MRVRSGTNWVIIHSLPTSKSFLLKNLLAKRFPKVEFSYFRFGSDEKIGTELLNASAGIILELKELAKTQLKTLDRLWRLTQGRPMISILSPEGFQLLNAKRPDFIQKTTTILSDAKSLDYLMHLPRFIEEIGRRQRLKMQNERLKRLMEKTESQNKDQSQSITEEVLTEVVGRNLCGLRVTLKKWTQLRVKLGNYAQSEILASIGRSIHSAVRNSDRVLHWKDDEFLILLENAEPKNLDLCRDRVKKCLDGLSIKANNRDMSFPFSVRQIERMSLITQA